MPLSDGKRWRLLNLSAAAKLELAREETKMAMQEVQSEGSKVKIEVDPKFMAENKDQPNTGEEDSLHIDAASDEPIEPSKDTDGADINDPSEGAENIIDEDTVITIGDKGSEEPDEEEVQAAPGWVKGLRKKAREDAQRLRELERQNQELLRAQQEREAKAAQVAGPGPRPREEDFDYDSDKYNAALDAWYDKRLNYEKAQAVQKAEQDAALRKQQEQIQLATARYEESKKKLAIAPQKIQEAEQTLMHYLTQEQQSVILDPDGVVKNPALVVYGLAQNPNVLEILRGIKNPVKFAAELARAEVQMKITKRRPQSKPQTVPTGSTAPVTGEAKELELARKKADATGDYSEVMAIKRRMRAANQG